jgi:hypothetical protein
VREFNSAGERELSSRRVVACEAIYPADLVSYGPNLV